MSVVTEKDCGLEQVAARCAPKRIVDLEKWYWVICW